MEEDMYTQYLNEHPTIQYYIDNPDEYEWFRCETHSLKQYCETHNLAIYKSRYSLRSFVHPKGYYPREIPEEKKEQIDWYIHWNRIYNSLVQRHTEYLNYLKEEEDKKMEKKVYNGLNLFWELLEERNPTLYKQFRWNQDNPHVAAELKKQQIQFVYSLIYEGKNLFESVV